MSLDKRLQAIEKRAVVGRTLFVWEGNAEALANIRAKCGPHDEVVSICWLRNDSQTTDEEIR
jgi:hypothetical protein